MLLFKSSFWPGLKSGAITLTFRLWDKPRVKVGTNQRTHPVGVLHIEDVRQVTIAEITEQDAERSGYIDRAALVASLAEFSTRPLEPSSRVVRVQLRYAGEADRVAGAEQSVLSSEDVSAIDRKLDVIDKQAGLGPWTRDTLRLIEKHPRVAASQLAAKVGRLTPPFKADVVKLKKLGLTESFEIGYDLTPRGRAYLKVLQRRP